MSEQEQLPRSRTGRQAEVDRMVRAAGDAVAPEHPQRGLLRAGLDGLRERLARVHVTCDQVEARAWADYVARLDRGLDELAVEVERAGREHDAPAEEVLYVHATRLELDGWQLRLDHARDGRGGSAGAGALPARAARELADYQKGGSSRADVERAMHGVRDSAAV